MNRMAIFHLVSGIIFAVIGSFNIINSILTRIQAIVWHETLSYEIMQETLSVTMFGILIGLILLIGGTSLSYHFYSIEKEKERIQMEKIN